MNRQPASLIGKLRFLLIGFSVFLLASLLMWFYFYNRDSIKRTAGMRAHEKMNLAYEGFEKTLHHSRYEIMAFFNYIDLNVLSQQSSFMQLQEILEPLKSMFFIPGQKIQSLQIFKNDMAKSLIIEPAISFGGSRHLILRWTEEKLPDISGDRLKVEKLSRGQSGQTVQMLTAWTHHTELTIKAFIHLDALMKDAAAINEAGRGIHYFICDLDGFIFYSNNSDYTGLFIAHLDPFSNNPIFNDTNEKTLLSGKIAWQYRHIQNADVFLLVGQSFAEELFQLRELFFKMMFFSIFIFLFVLVLTHRLTSGMSRVLKKVTSVAKKVTGGDFSHQITISRNDEFGLLVDAFNRMIREIGNNYALLQNANKQLEIKIHELTQTREELSQKQRLALIGETISKISHEIQNKIGGISIWIQNLEQAADQKEHAQTCIDEMKKALQQFMNMLAGFKRFYREPRLDKTHINPADMINRCVKTLKSEIEAKNIQIDIKIEPELKYLYADETLLEEALINCLINAVFFTPENSVIEMIINQHENTAQIKICDSGPGIKEKDMPYLFHPFYTTKTSGSGLGLATAANTMYVHGGNITAENRDEGGACFILHLSFSGECEQ